MYGFFGVLLGVFVVFLIWVSFASVHHSIIAEQWMTKCRTDGGQVVFTDARSFSNHYECYKDSKIINHIED